MPKGTPKTSVETTIHMILYRSADPAYVVPADEAKALIGEIRRLQAIVARVRKAAA